MSLHLSMRDQDSLRQFAAPHFGIPVETLADDMILIGVLQGENIIAAVGFNGFYGSSADIHIASNGRRAWLNRRIIKAIACYAFLHRNLKRLNAVLPVWNRDAQIFAIKIGGVPEGYMRKAAEDGGDAVMIGILREDCPFLLSAHGERHEQIGPDR